MNELMEILSVWWLKVLFDPTIVYCFLKVAAGSKNKPDNYTSNVKISEKVIP